MGACTSREVPIGHAQRPMIEVRVSGKGAEAVEGAQMQVRLQLCLKALRSRTGIWFPRLLQDGGVARVSCCDAVEQLQAARRHDICLVAVVVGQLPQQPYKVHGPLTTCDLNRVRPPRSDIDVHD